MVTNSLCMCKCLPGFINPATCVCIYYSTITLMSIIKKSLEDWALSSVNYEKSLT